MSNSQRLAISRVLAVLIVVTLILTITLWVPILDRLGMRAVEPIFSLAAIERGNTLSWGLALIPIGLGACFFGNLFGRNLFWLNPKHLSGSQMFAEAPILWAVHVSMFVCCTAVVSAPFHTYERLTR